MPSFNSIVPYTGDGNTTRWPVNFAGGYISTSHVFVVIDGTATPATFEGSSTVVISPAMASGISFTIERRTPVDEPLVDYRQGADFSEENLDTTARQSVFTAAEAKDRTDNDAGRAIRGPVGETLAELPDAAQRMSKLSAFDAAGQPIAKSAAELGLELAMSNAALAANAAGDRNRANHTGQQAISTVTGLQTQFDQRGLNVMDFAPDGTTVGTGNAVADTAAWQAALSALYYSGRRRLIVPKAQYLINATLTPPANLNCVEIVAEGGYDGIRGPLNFGLFTSLKWVGATDATKAVIQFDQATGVVWRGISINCDYKAGYGLQLMSSSLSNGGVKNIVERCSMHYALRDGIIVGEWGDPTVGPGGRQFFGNCFQHLTFYGCGQSAIHINEWNADQQYFDSVMTYLDDGAIPQNALNGIWFDSGGQHSTLINCQSGGQTVVSGVPSSGYMIRNQKSDSSAGGAFGLTVINCWQEGEGGLYYGVTSTNDHKAFKFQHCASFTNNPANRSVYIDKGTSAEIPYSFDTCTFLGSIEIASTTFGKQSLSLDNCIFADGQGVVDANGILTVDGTCAQVGTTGNQLVVPRFADVFEVTLDETLAVVYTEGVTKKGDRITVVVNQDATGGHTVNWAASGNFAAQPAVPQPNPAASAATSYTFVSDGSLYYLTAVEGLAVAAPVTIPPVKRAMAKKSADEVAANYSGAGIVAWDAEVFDNATLHDTTTNNTRFTVGADTSSVQCGCSIALSLVDPNVIYSLVLKKNGSTVFDGACGMDANSVSNSGPAVAVTSGPIPVVEGDYFEWQLYCADASVTIVAARSNAWMTVLA